MRLVIFKEYFILDIFKVLPLILSGAIYNSSNTTTLTVKKAHIELLSNIDNLPTNMDGDAGPYMPVDLEVLPRVLKVFAPTKTSKEKTASLAIRTPLCWQTRKGGSYYAKSIVLYRLTIEPLHVSGSYKYNLLSQAYLSIVLGPLCRGPFVFL